MRFARFSFIVPAILCLLPTTALARATQRPNVVLLMADDMGYSDIGCYGGEIRTPNVDRLAANGLRFTNFFNTARCCPTRASLMTGLYPHQAGVGWMTADWKKDGYRGQLNDRCMTIAELLQLVGYRTYMVGKWHLTRNTAGPADASWPMGRGFQRFFGTLTGAGSFYNPTTLTRDNTPIKAGKDFYYTDEMGRAAVSFLREHYQQKKDDPFFLYVAFTAPHWPMHALKEDIARYENVYTKGWNAIRDERFERMKKLGLVEPGWKMAEWDKTVPHWNTLSAERRKEMAHKMAVYAAMIDRLDQNVGRIVKQLEDQKALDNTLILFLADNGGCAEGDLFGFERQPGGVVGEDSSFASYGRGWAFASNTFFRLFKHWVHAGGVSTPLVVHWPARISEKGELRRQPGHLIDVMATCAELSGATYPVEHKGQKLHALEGKSLVPAFANKAIEREAIYWEHEDNRAILAGKWKLVSEHPKAWELYDFEADRAETNDLAARHPDVVRDLSARWQTWANRVGVESYTELLKKNPVKKGK
jgi:arylsulfatase